MVVFSWAVVSFCIELFCVVTLQYQILVRIAITYFIIEKKKAVNTKKTVRKNMLLRTVCIFGQFCKLVVYLLTLLTFPYFQGFPPLKILYMYPFPLFLPLWDNYKGKFIIQLFNRCLPLYQEVLRKSALLPL